jgi:hypothetical protein
VDFEAQLFTGKFSLFPVRLDRAQFDSMGMVDGSVKDAVGQRWIADLFMPTQNRQLRRQEW